ncbi:hypothetical protein F4Y59_06725 [Candidatus Poribacteria bacterium]|nr:hypothetical protein [Candidatus Poribacteria bacterium]
MAYVTALPRNQGNQWKPALWRYKLPAWRAFVGAPHGLSAARNQVSGEVAEKPASSGPLANRVAALKGGLTGGVGHVSV